MLIQNYDLVICLSIDQINAQLYNMFNSNKISFNKKFKWSQDISSALYEMDAEILTPTVSPIEGKPQSLLFEFKLGKGNFKVEYYEIPKGPLPKGKLPPEPKIVKKTAPTQGIIYAFVVNLGQISINSATINKTTSPLASIDATNEVIAQREKYYKEAQIPAEDFLVDSLFLDFENSEFDNYNSNISSFPEEIETIFKEVGAGLSIFQNALHNYYKNLYKTNKDNPYIISYSTKVKFPQVQNTKATYAPTYCTFSISYVSLPLIIFYFNILKLF